MKLGDKDFIAANMVSTVCRVTQALGFTDTADSLRAARDAIELAAMAWRLRNASPHSVTMANELVTILSRYPEGVVTDQQVEKAKWIVSQLKPSDFA